MSAAQGGGARARGPGHGRELRVGRAWSRRSWASGPCRRCARRSRRRASSSPTSTSFELNEAFAAQSLAVVKELGIEDDERQPARRRDRARPPDRGERRAHPRHAAARDEAHGLAPRARHALRRRRPGPGGHHPQRQRLTAAAGRARGPRAARPRPRADGSRRGTPAAGAGNRTVNSGPGSVEGGRRRRVPSIHARRHLPADRSRVLPASFSASAARADRPLPLRLPRLQRRALAHRRRPRRRQGQRRLDHGPRAHARRRHRGLRPAGARRHRGALGPQPPVPGRAARSSCPARCIFLYNRSRPIYERLRNTILATWLLSIPVYAAFPVAPPRLADVGLVDTITHADRLRAWTPS